MPLQVPEYIEELLGGDLSGAAAQQEQEQPPSQA